MDYNTIGLIKNSGRPPAAQRKEWMTVENAMISIVLDGKKAQVAPGTTLLALTKGRGKGAENPVVAALRNNRVCELYHCAQEGDDIRLLDLSDENGNRVYFRGLLHLFVQAVKKVLHGGDVDVQHAINEGLYCERLDGKPFTPFELDAIEREMRATVERDEPFVRQLIARDEAIAFYRSEGAEDKARLLSFREDNVFKVYSCGGMSDYFYGHMPPSTGYLTRFQVIYSYPGCLILYPHCEEVAAPLVYTPQPKLSHVLRESEHWADEMGCATVADLNAIVARGGLPGLIRVSEALHERCVVEMAEAIKERGKRVVLIAGPSSSGKTTFMKRLAVQLRAGGQKTERISLDNYYIDRDKLAPGPDGKQDFETIDALDVPRFNRDLANILAHQEVQLPRFDFKDGKSKPGRLVRLDEEGVLLVEGIHGLNDRLTESVAEEEKYRIYISALTQLNLDHHNRIPTSCARLLRRLVRDAAHRGSAAERTLGMWPSVREGESRWIFPNQERADYMFNSTLIYELLFVKRLATPLLTAVKEDDPAFPEANYLAKFLKYFVDPGPGAEQAIPANSLLREFIGGSCFGQ